MKWIVLVCGILLIFAAWLIVQVGKGVFFTHSGFAEWDEELLAAYRECCFMTDLRSAVPFALLGLVLLGFVAWKFLRNYANRSQSSHLREQHPLVPPGHSLLKTLRMF
ncbi:hypothetical protein [Phaeobacter sp. JH20_02]|uniref:hypothetical protein n=2 Tax=unclassified Phaeobacter TaxID=2621772 RepID=UPI003A88A5D8